MIIDLMKEAYPIALERHLWLGTLRISSLLFLICDLRTTTMCHWVLKKTLFGHVASYLQYVGSSSLTRDPTCIGNSVLSTETPGKSCVIGSDVVLTWGQQWCNLGWVNLLGKRLPLDHSDEFWTGSDQIGLLTPKLKTFVPCLREENEA